MHDLGAGDLAPGAARFEVEGADLAADLLAYLTREGPHPRLAMARSLVDAIVARATRSAAASPRYSLAGELLRERDADGVTALELAATASTWAE